MKKALSLILVLVMLLGMMPMTAFAAEETKAAEPEATHEHDDEAVVTEPSGTEQGYTTYTCACGDSYLDDYVDATGHTYENGICTGCGATIPNPYVGKTIACVGDSITVGVGVTSGETDYVTLLAKSLGMEYIRLGASGTTLCTGGHRTCNLKQLTEAKLAGADVVTILMGINDFDQAKEGYYTLGTIDSTDTSTIYGAVHMWCQRIEELRKTESLADTEFYFLTPVITAWNHSVAEKNNWDQSKTTIHGYTLRDLCNAIIEVCALYDVPVIDLNLISGIYYNSAEDNNVGKFGNDGIHPGANGHAMMAFALENALLRNNLKNDHDHVYGSWITTTYPSCENGEEKRVCAVCSATESRQVDALGHIYENGICTGCGDHISPVITQQPESVQQEIGKKFAITVKAEGEGLTYQWYYKDAGMKNFAKSSNKTSSYAYTMQTYMHNRQVYCVITDANGNSVQTETATITRPPQALRIVEQPQDAQQEIGVKFSIKPTVQGDGLTYQWYYKDAGMKNFAKSSNRTSAYAYTMQSYMKGRQVYCVITDKYGNSVTTDVATISLPPVELKILEQPTDVYASKGEKFSISFEVQGDGLTYQWYVKESGAKTFKVSSNKTSAYAYSMQNYMNGRQVYCVITDQYGNQVVTEVVTIHLEK